MIPLRQTIGFLNRRSLAAALAAFVLLNLGNVASASPTYREIIASVQPKIVKIYGAGGFQRLEAYQSGFLISSDGLILTSWSYVLDTDVVTVTLDDGRKYQAQLKGYDPRVEIALLEIEAEDLPHFNLDEAVELETGDRVLAFSNLYGVATGNEPVSVLHGRVSAKTKLATRQSTLQTPYRGSIYVLDAMTNNPGAAGGALTDRNGRLAGFVGREMRNSMDNTWLNYAIPIGEIMSSVDAIREGRLILQSDSATAEKPVVALTPSLLGIVLVPDVLNKTPPFIDEVRADSAASKAGLRPDDLVLFVGDRVASSCKTLRDALSFVDRDASVKLLIQRGQQLFEVELSATD